MTDQTLRRQRLRMQKLHGFPGDYAIAHHFAQAAASPEQRRVPFALLRPSGDVERPGELANVECLCLGAPGRQLWGNRRKVSHQPFWHVGRYARTIRVNAEMTRPPNNVAAVSHCWRPDLVRQRLGSGVLLLSSEVQLFYF